MKKKLLTLTFAAFMLPMLGIKTANALPGEELFTNLVDTTGEILTNAGDTLMDIAAVPTSGKYLAGLATGVVLYPATMYAARQVAAPVQNACAAIKDTITWFFTNPIGTAITASTVTAAAATGLYLIAQ